MPDITGVETLKALVGAVEVSEFTVDGLAEQTGVSRRTVDTVVRRYSEFFERADTRTVRTGPGRPPVAWALQPDRVPAVVSLIEKFANQIDHRQSVLSDAPVPEVVEPSLVMAATSITDAFTSPRDEMKQLLCASRDSLIAAGFNSDGEPWGRSVDRRVQVKAKLIARVADLVEALMEGGQDDIDEAQLQAIPKVKDASPVITAAEWLPLARNVANAGSTVLSSPVIVEHRWRHQFEKMFPALVSCQSSVIDWAGDVEIDCLSDSRVTTPGPVPIHILYEPSLVDLDRARHQVGPGHLLVIGGRVVNYGALGGGNLYH